MATYKTPGVYVEEISKLPPSIAPVKTALPAFIGYTQKAESDGASLLQVPTRITSLLEYELYFGGAPAQHVTLWLDNQNNVIEARVNHSFYLYDSLRLFFANGGGDCMIVSVGDYASEISAAALSAGLNSIEKLAGPTIIVMAEAVATETHGAPLYQSALTQCARVLNRVTICDLGGHADKDTFMSAVADFRNEIGSANLKYGAVYGPWLITSFTREIRFGNITLKRKSDNAVILPESLTTDADVLALIAQIRLAEKPVQALKKDKSGFRKSTKRNTDLSLEELYIALALKFDLFKTWVEKSTKALNTLPPSGAIAGVYCYVDSTRGVWKAPANIAVNEVKETVATFTTFEQDDLNVDTVAGKSVNSIRAFAGKGILVWGARTLAGNDNEWRYIPVRRFFSFVAASIELGTQAFVFEPNDANTWLKTQAMIENFLTKLWRDGALQGAKPEHAFFVHIGLGKTMTALNILEGRMNIEVGMAPVRPAEFIILKFSHKMLEQ